MRAPERCLLDRAGVELAVLGNRQALAQLVAGVKAATTGCVFIGISIGARGAAGARHGGRGNGPPGNAGKAGGKEKAGHGGLRGVMGFMFSAGARRRHHTEGGVRPPLKGELGTAPPSPGRAKEAGRPSGGSTAGAWGSSSQPNGRTPMQRSWAQKANAAPAATTTTTVMTVPSAVPAA